MKRSFLYLIFALVLASNCGKGAVYYDFAYSRECTLHCERILEKTAPPFSGLDLIEAGEEDDDKDDDVSLDKISFHSNYTIRKDVVFCHFSKTEITVFSNKNYLKFLCIYRI